MLPYHANVPSFGDWGFVVAGLRRLSPDQIRLPQGLKTRFLSPKVIPSLFVFAKDIAWRQTPVNRLDDQVLVRLYERGFRRYNQ